MYAINDNGTLRLIGSLPSRLRLPDGLTRTSLDELDGKQLSEIGIYPVKEDKPAINPATQFLGEPTLKLAKGQVTATYPVIDKSKEQIAAEVEAAKSAKLAELADARWQAETGGLTLPDGTIIKTDRESQGLLTAAAVMAKFDPTMTVEWKAATGWIDLDAATVIQLAGAVRQHVQGQFSKERALSEKVNACTSAEEVRGVVWG